MGRGESSGKKQQYGLFKPPRHKDLSSVITYESIPAARRAAQTLIGMFVQTRSREKRLTILRATYYAANRAEAGAKNSLFSSATKKRWRKIAQIYRNAAEWMSRHYNSS